MTRARVMKLDYADMSAKFGAKFGVTAFGEMITLSKDSGFPITDIMGVCLITGNTSTVRQVIKYAQDRCYKSLWDLPTDVISNPPVDTPAPPVITPPAALTREELARLIVGELDRQYQTVKWGGPYCGWMAGDSFESVTVDGSVNMLDLADMILTALGKKP